MAKRFYFEHKKYAEDTRRMLEENTGVPTELCKNSKGWYCKVKGGYKYTTADGYTVEVGAVVYDAHNNPYQVREVDYAKDQVWVRVVPRDFGEPDKDKDVREGIIWFVERLPEILVEMKRRGKSKFTFSNNILRHPIRNAIDGRRGFGNGDYICSIKTKKLWKIDVSKGYTTITESEADIRELDKTLQSVVLVGEEARIVTDVDMLLGSSDSRFKSIELFYVGIRDDKVVKRQDIINGIVRVLTSKWLYGALFGVFALTAMLCMAFTVADVGKDFVSKLGFASFAMAILMWGILNVEGVE